MDANLLRYKLILPDPGDPGAERSFDVSQWAAQNKLPVTSRDDYNAILVAGGDGLLMETARSHIDNNAVIVGLNRGTRGFLANQIRIPEEVPTHLDQLELMTLYLMKAIFTTTSGEIIEHYAFNEVALKVADAGYPSFSVTGEMKWFRERHVSGDGIIVATPQGSTGYALKARDTAAFIEIDSYTWVIVGIATGPYPCDKVKPQKITINVEHTRQPVHGYADGQKQIVRDVQQVIVEPTNSTVTLGFLKDSDFKSRRSDLANSVERGLI